MAVAEQFAGLEMDKLIGAPLSAAADASIQLADSTAEFIDRVGFDGSGKMRTAAFAYQKRSANEDGTTNLDEMKVEVPILAIVPIPNLQIDEVNVLFDMEVKQSEKKENSLDVGVGFKGKAKIGAVKVSISGSVSTHNSNTRSSDNSAKYHVDVKATNHGTPEGLARVLDMMAANVSPMLVSSQLKDGNGQNLSESARLQAEQLKRLRQEIANIETRQSAAKNSLDSNIQQLKNIAESQQNTYQAKLTRLLNGLDISKAEDEAKASAYSDIMEEVAQSWDNFKNQAGNLIKLLADSSEKDQDKVSDIFALKAFKEEKADIYAAGESQYTALLAAQNSAVKAQTDVNGIETELLNKKAEYSNAISGNTTNALPGGNSGIKNATNAE